MQTVNDLTLPRLPISYTEYDLQAWWQIVVSRIENSVNSLNDTIAAIIAGDQDAAIAQGQLIAVAAQLHALKAVLDPVGEEMALIATRLAKLDAETNKLRLKADYTETVAWLL
jgi:hypothetical protein